MTNPEMEGHVTDLSHDNEVRIDNASASSLARRLTARTSYALVVRKRARSVHYREADILAYRYQNARGRETGELHC